MLATTLAALSLFAFANAQQVHDVTVGGTGDALLTFQPPAVYASIGDTVRFSFRQKNHTVTQTSFGNVCHPLLDDSHQLVFDSGFQAVAAEQTDEFPTVDYHVQTTDPLWFYCAQKAHCGRGMVFAINCPDSGPNSLDNFVQSALEVGAREAAYEAASSSWAATATPDVYGGQTYAPVFHPVVTETVTLGEEVWTTTYESHPNSPDPTPDAAEGIEHRVIVGGDGSLTYDPPAIQAAVRDRITFEFRSKNHTITQSSFGNPCRKLEFTSTTGQIGFDSSFVPVSADATEFPTYTVTVNDTAPIWAYCRQGPHCGLGMVFSVNADEASERNHEAFVTLAKTINGTAAPPAPSSGDVTDNESAAITIQAGVASIMLLAVGSFFTLAF